MSYRKGTSTVNTNPLIFFFTDNETIEYLAGLKHAFSGNLIFKYFLLQVGMVVMGVTLAAALAFIK